MKFFLYKERKKKSGSLKSPGRRVVGVGRRRRRV
jgi:hypothetical protein